MSSAPSLNPRASAVHSPVLSAVHPARLIARLACVLLGLSTLAGFGFTPSPTSTPTGTPAGTPIGTDDGARAVDALLSPLAPRSVPAARRAENVAVITIEGAIDAVTSISVRRRITEAEQSGADALVFDIDSPGGEVGAVLEICNAIKLSPIQNSVGWVNPDAYSGGAIIAFACRRLIVNDPASIGDALAILVGPMGVQRVPQELRAKYIPPVVAELTDSARRYGHDEYIMQAVASDGIELWLVERTEGEPVRFAIDESEYRAVFGDAPPRGMPLLGTVPGERTAVDSPPPLPEPEPEPAPVPDSGDTDTPADDDRADEPADELGDERDEIPEELRFRPAGTALEDIGDEISDALAIASTRPIFDESQRGRWRLMSYVSDGSGAIVMGGDQLEALGFDVEEIRDDAELLSYFGATNMVRLDESWSESTVRFMTSMWVRGILIAILLVGLAIEMASPGLVAPGAVALVAFVGLIVPPMIVGLAGWWEVAAILGGIVLIGFEIFVTPGFGVFGVAGLIALFAGLVGTFVPSGSGGGLFPNSPQAQQDLLYGTVTVFLALVTAGVTLFFIGRHVGSIPVLSKLVLTQPASAADGTLAAAVVDGSASAAPVGVGDIGTTLTDLRPVGKADFGPNAVEVTAESGYLAQNTRVRVIAVESLRIIVAPDDEQPNGATA